jgi:hypothetical protein
VLHNVYGITQDSETKNYMVVFNDICEKCIRVCCSIHFQQNFKNWTSGNDKIDKFIQSTQLLDCYASKALEWIPYNRLYNIKYFTKSEFGKEYRANWIDGCINYWDNYNKNLKRDEPNMFVILKILNNPATITSKFINNVRYKFGFYFLCKLQLYYTFNIKNFLLF